MVRPSPALHALQELMHSVKEAKSRAAAACQGASPEVRSCRSHAVHGHDFKGAAQALLPLDKDGCAIKCNCVCLLSVP